MGEARRRALAEREGRPWGRPNACPKCAGRAVDFKNLRTMEASPIRTRIAVCRACGTLWEAYPKDWSDDVCAATPCDNCAFRPGSPEIRDREGWKRLLANLKAGQEFRCHKGAPMFVDPKALTAEFDDAWIEAHGRTCAGFHRAIMTRPGWLEARYPELAKLQAEGGQ